MNNAITKIALTGVNMIMPRGERRAHAVSDTRRIDSIIVIARFRLDLGDIDALARSINEIGLLHPIPIRPNGQLIAGTRRLAAAKQLGWTEIPVTAVDIDAVVRGEYADNIHRKDFTYAESVAIMREIKPLEEAAAKKRQGTRTDRHPGNLPTSSGGCAGEKAAKATGKKRRTLEKAEQVVAAAEQSPERFVNLVERLNEDGVKVDAVFREMKQRRERAAFEARVDNGARIGCLEAMAQAAQRVAVIYANPPWDFKIYSPNGKQRSAERYYDTSTLEAIKALPIAPLAASDCALFLWGVWPELPGALEVIKAWSFEYKTAAFVWVKQNRDGDGLFTGMGYWTQANSEFCLLATKRSPPCVIQDVPQIIIAPVGEHSEKPETAGIRIERLLVGPTSNCLRAGRSRRGRGGNEIASPRKALQAPAGTAVADSIDATTASSVADNLVLPPIPVPPTSPADGINTTTSSATDDGGLSDRTAQRDFRPLARDHKDDPSGGEKALRRQSSRTAVRR